MLSILPLGCYGSDLENKKCITMQVTPSTVIDTGALLSSLDTPQLVDIRNVIITHCHFDHIKNLPIFSDFMLSLGGHSFNLYTTENIMKQILDHVLNDLIWPDFTKLPTKKKPTINFIPVYFDRPFIIDQTEFVPLEMNHLVESMGFIIRKGKSSAAYSGDTYSCERFVDAINSDRTVKTVCWEASFPNRLEKIAVASKHLTPELLEIELNKVKKKCDIHTFHLKPNLEDEIMSDLLKIKSRMTITAMKQKKPISI